MDKIYDKVAGHLLKENYIEESNYQVYRYGIQMFFEITASLAASIIISCLFGMILECLIFFAVFIPLRSYLGGFHMSSYGACFICSILTFTGILVLIAYISPSPLLSFIIIMISMVMIFIESIQDSRSSEDGNYFFRQLCLIMIVILCLSLCFFLAKDYSKMFLLACTSLLAVISKILE